MPYIDERVLQQLGFTADHISLVRGNREVQETAAEPATLDTTSGSSRVLTPIPTSTTSSRVTQGTVTRTTLVFDNFDGDNDELNTFRD